MRKYTNHLVPEGYITPSEAAQIIGVAKVTVLDWVKHHGAFSFKSRHAGSKTFYYIKRDEVDKYAQQTKEPKGHVYEIVHISLGTLTVLFKADNLRELSLMYIKLMERNHQLIRVRLDGKVLTIHESDKLGNACHPRTKKRGAAV